MKLTVIDWETLGIKPTAKVISIGATTFDISSKYPNEDTHFYTNISLEGQENRTITESTISWWKQQSPQAQSSSYTAPNETKMDFKAAINGLRAHIITNGSKGIIGNGMSFDNAILANICDELKLDYPVKFWQDYDLRTMKLLAGIDKPEWPPILIQHNALHDAIYEAICARAYWSKCNGEN